MTLAQQFREAYVAALTERNELQPEFAQPIVIRGNTGTTILPVQTPAEIADKMIEAVKKDTKGGGRSDWFNNNPTMKKAGRKVGIKTSRELRELLAKEG